MHPHSRIHLRVGALALVIAVALFVLQLAFGPQVLLPAVLLVCAIPTALNPPTHTTGITAIPILTDERGGDFLYLPVAAATKIPAGVIVCIDGNGRAVNGADTVGLRVAGRAEESIDNTSGAAGDLSINIRRGAFKWTNSVANAITAAMIGKQAFVEDNNTIASTTTNKVGGGRIVAVDSDGIWVDTRRASGAASLTDNSTGTAGTAIAAGAGVQTVSLPLILSKIGNAAILLAYVPGYAFKLLSATVAVTNPATTAAKLATITPQITGVNVTGGVVALTSANCTPLGALVAGSAITALNTGSATDSISLIGSGVTAFVEGEAVLLLKVQNMDTANALSSLSALNA